MDGWHLHALIECMFAQYFSTADGFIRHIDLEGRQMEVDDREGNEQKGMEEEREGTL